MGRIMRIVLLAAVLAFVAFAAADELKDLSSADVTAPDSKVAKKEEANLGEEAGFAGGALMTSGSFTMMAASSGIEEEEGELGEGAGFAGGALMTSGSFTMMAASSGIE